MKYTTLFSSLYNTFQSRQSFSRRGLQTCFALTPLLALGQLSYAQESTQNDSIEEVVVTGEFRDISLLKLANSVSVIDEEAIKNRNAQSLDEVLNLAPNVNFSSGASRGRFIQIRGIGERSQFVSPINPSVGVIVDGIDMTGISLGVTTLDTKQIEIFRGPQGTLFGANALAGLINVVGSEASEDLFLNVKAGLGNFDSHYLTGTISTALNESVAWRFSAKQNNSDGFIKNLTPAADSPSLDSTSPDTRFVERDDTNNIDELSLRNLLSFNVSDTLNIGLTSYYIDIDNGYDAFSLDGNRTTFSDRPGHDRQETFANALAISYTGFQFANWETTLSNADSDLEYGFDEDWSYEGIHPFGYGWTDNYERENKNTTLDSRFVSKNYDSALNWTAGFYYRDQSVDLDRLELDHIFNEIQQDYQSKIDTTNYALYGQVDYAINDKTTLRAGLRAERREADFIDSENVSFDPSESFLGGKLSLEYDIHDNAIVYALFSKGYKAGGFNPESNISAEFRSFETEDLFNYEIGTKGQWFDNSLTGQFVVFYQRRENMQVEQSFSVPEDDGIRFVEFLGNAPEATNYGIEAETVWSVNPWLSLFASLGLLEAEFDEFVSFSHVDRDSNTGAGVDLSGRDQAHAPSYQYFAGAEFTITSSIYTRLEFEGKDEFNFSNSHDNVSSSYDLINLSVNYSIADIELSLWAKNITDEDVETRGFFFGNDPRANYEAQVYTQLGAPRTFGLTASYTYQ